MDNREKTHDKSGGDLKRSRLKELAAEASRRVDEILPGGEAACVVEKLVQMGTVRASGDPAAASVPREQRDVVPAASEKSANRADSRPDKPSALVVHVSRGMARVLANVLTQMGLRVHVASSSEEIDSSFSGGHWDVLFVQGSSLPYPGRALAARVVEHYSESGSSIVLIARTGDALLPEAARWRTVGLLRWPFSPKKVGETLAEVLPPGAMLPAR